MSPGKLRLDIDTTRDRLLALGCSYAAEHLDHLLTEAVGEAMAPHAFLDRLLEVEQSGREGRRVKTSLQSRVCRSARRSRTSTSPFSRRSSAPGSTRWRRARGSAMPRPC